MPKDIYTHPTYRVLRWLKWCDQLVVPKIWIDVSASENSTPDINFHGMFWTLLDLVRTWIRKILFVYIPTSGCMSWRLFFDEKLGSFTRSSRAHYVNTLQCRRPLGFGKIDRINYIQGHYYNLPLKVPLAKGNCKVIAVVAMGSRISKQFSWRSGKPWDQITTNETNSFLLICKKKFLYKSD